MESPAPITRARAHELWTEIVSTTREACLLRQEGREENAVRLLQQTLPTVIRDWSNLCGETPDRCRTLLRELFSREQETARAAMLQRRLIVDEVCARLQNRTPRQEIVESRIFSQPAPSTLQLRRRVPIDDVVGLIDALQQTERNQIDEAVLPVRPNFSSLSFVGQTSISGEVGE